ncbi:MAG: hypothetical protein IJ173_09385 [Kiritimatiellae bacterium]|nr:hypothetical protein [Kiritimatiellia bacterium]
MMTTKETICGNNKEEQATVAAAETDTTLTFTATAGTTYHIFPIYYNRNTWFKIVSVEYPGAVEPVALTLAAGEGGAVAINGVSGAGAYTVQKGEFVKLVATPNAYYGLSSWTDGEDAELSTDEEFWCYVGDTMSVTANFASESAIDITRTADFSTFAGDDGITAATEAWSQQVGRLEVHGAAVDTLTDAGIYWAGPKETSATATSASSNDRYVKFECVKSGTLTLTFKSDGTNGGNYGRIYVTNGTSDGTACMYKTNGDSGYKANATAQNKDTTGTFDVEAGQTYYIWPYMYSQSTAKFWVSSITYTAAKSDYSALTVTDEYGDTSVTNVYWGDSVLLDAPATTETQIFAGWTVATQSASETLAPQHVRVNVTEATSATATYREADVHAFVWNWNVAEGAWNDPANWYYEGIIPATTYPSDAAADYATFNTEATVTLTEAAAARELWANAPVTLKGNTLTTQKVAAYENDEGIVLQDAGFANLSGNGIEISCNLCINGNCWVSQYDTSAQISGNLTGNGKLSLWNSNKTYTGAKLSGDNREFAGEVVFSGGSNRRYQKWAYGNATSPNAFWTVETGWPSGIGNDDGDMLGSSGTYWFGGYDGGIWRRNFGSGTYTLEIGALNTASTIDIKSTYGSPNVVKVGTANLTLKSTTIYNLTINGGSVTMPVGIAPKTLTIAADTKIYLKGDAAWTAGTVTNLFSYTTLAGAGTLAEQVEVTGLAQGLVAKIAVAENTVTATIEAAVPATDDESATITENGDGSYTVEVTAETVAITVPDGVTVSEVVVSPDTATVTGVPASATVKVKVSWTDAQNVSQSVAYEIVKVDSTTGAVSLDEDEVVTVGSEEIPLKPVPSDATDDEKPLEVSSDSVSVGVKTIPGLVYRLNRGTSPDDVSSTVSSAKATSARLRLADNTELPEGASFYRVSVDVK